MHEPNSRQFFFLASTPEMKKKQKRMGESVHAGIGKFMLVYTS